MKTGRTAFLDVIYRFLLILVLCLVFIFAGGTVYSILRNDPPPVQVKPDQHNIHINASEQIFSGMGRLRLPVSGSHAATVILSISFPYDPGDRPFSEELAARIGNFRTIAGEYFLSFELAEIKRKGEEEIKIELLDRFNNILRLGKIEILYFNDFMIIE